MPNKFWDSTDVGQATTVTYPAMSGDEPVAKAYNKLIGGGLQQMKQHKIKHTHPPIGEEAPEIVYGYWKKSGEGELMVWGEEPSQPSLRLTRDLNDVIRNGSTEVLIFKFDRVGTINIEVK